MINTASVTFDPAPKLMLFVTLTFNETLMFTRSADAGGGTSLAIHTSTMSPINSAMPSARTTGGTEVAEHVTKPVV